MLRSKRRKSGWLRYLLPIDSAQRPRVGDQVVTISPAGDPRHRSTSLKSAYFVSRNLPIGPVILSDFINVEPLTNEQCGTLQDLLGVPITKISRKEIDAAIYRLVATIALSEHIPDWSGFKNPAAQNYKVWARHSKKRAAIGENDRSQNPEKIKAQRNTVGRSGCENVSVVSRSRHIKY